MALGVAILSYSLFIEPSWIDVEHIEISLPGAAPELADLNIAFVADIHVESVGARERRFVSRMTELDIDILLVGGDFITVGYYMTDVLRSAEVACSLLAEIPVRHGRYAIFGNNDFPNEMRPLLLEHDIRPLENEWVRLDLPERSLTILGLGDALTARIDWTAALSPPPPPPVLAMAHSPDAFRGAADNGLPVLLAGHTHGGQVRHPLIGVAPHIFLHLLPGTPAYRAGFYESGGSRLYVTRGVGLSRLPIRFLCRPEITMITLTGPPSA